MSKSVQRVCSGCRKIFEQRGDQPSLYCSKRCAERERKSRKRYREKHGDGACPTPMKRIFRRIEDAEEAIRSVSDTTMSVYRCPCGALHIGHRKTSLHQAVKVGGQAIPVPVDMDRFFRDFGVKIGQWNRKSWDEVADLVEESMIRISEHNPRDVEAEYNIIGLRSTVFEAYEFLQDVADACREIPRVEVEINEGDFE